MTALRDGGAGKRPTFALVQAARGLAALWVVLFHIEQDGCIPDLARALPRWIEHPLLGYGSAGVAIFFVLSGFVIAHSLAGSAMTGRRLAAFVARRSIRLDPAYWASMVIAVGVAAGLAALKHEPIALPSGRLVLIHMLYLQELLGRPELLIVYWTLTYEVQFYLVLAFARFAAHSFRAERREAAWHFIFAVLVAFAFGSAVVKPGWIPHGLFLTYWHGFVLGVLSYEAGWRRRSRWALIALAAVSWTASLWRPEVFNAPCAATAVILFAAARGGWLVGGLRQAPWQWLGRISYSLYLVHVPAIEVGVRVWSRVAGHGVAADTGGLIVLLAASLLAAWGLWWLVERPTHEWAARLFRPPTPREPPLEGRA